MKRLTKLSIVLGLLIIISIAIWKSPSRSENSIAPLISTNPQRSASLLAAHQNYNFQLPKDWIKMNPTMSAGLYALVELGSPDFIPEHDVLRTPDQQAIIFIATSIPAENDATINDILNGKSEKPLVGGLPVNRGVSNQRKVTLGGIPAVEYLWAWEGPKMLITTADRDGVRYDVVFNDVSIFEQHSDQYYQVIKSFSFK